GNVLRQFRDQESADRLSRRLGGLWGRVQLPGVAQLDVDVSGRLLHGAAPRWQRLDLGRQRLPSVRRTVSRGASTRAWPLSPGTEGRPLQRQRRASSVLLVEQRRR